jgi:hypothetical protein
MVLCDDVLLVPYIYIFYLNNKWSTQIFSCSVFAANLISIVKTPQNRKHLHSTQGSILCWLESDIISHKMSLSYGRVTYLATIIC